MTTALKNSRHKGSGCMKPPLLGSFSPMPPESIEGPETLVVKKNGLPVLASPYNKNNVQQDDGPFPEILNDPCYKQNTLLQIPI